MQLSCENLLMFYNWVVILKIVDSKSFLINTLLVKFQVFNLLTLCLKAMPKNILLWFCPKVPADSKVKSMAEPFFLPE